MTLRVGLNLIFLVPGETGGMEVYARELVPRLAAMEDLEVTAFVNQEAAGEDFGCEQVVVPVNARSRVEWVRGEQLLLPKLAESRGCELVHSLASTAPVHGNFRRIVTIHDLMYKIVPEAHFGLRGLGMRVLVPLAARSSHRIIVDAESTREDLHKHLGTPRGKISVVPLAGATVGVVPPTPEAELRRSLDLGARDILLTVSAKRPHKNLVRLLDALALLPEPRPLLVMPGYPTPHEEELKVRAGELDLHDDVRFVGWTSPEDLEGLYALAKGFVFPSLYEGFGLPVLEAMARGVPVACSNGGSLAEVAGDAALLFDPRDTQAISLALSAIVGSRHLAGRGRRGLERSERHSWQRTARLTAETYRAKVKHRSSVAA